MKNIKLTNQTILGKYDTDSGQHRNLRLKVKAHTGR